MLTSGPPSPIMSLLGLSLALHFEARPFEGMRQLFQQWSDPWGKGRISARSLAASCCTFEHLAAKCAAACSITVVGLQAGCCHTFTSMYKVLYPYCLPCSYSTSTSKLHPLLTACSAVCQPCMVSDWLPSAIWHLSLAGQARMMCLAIGCALICQ